MLKQQLFKGVKISRGYIVFLVIFLLATMVMTAWKYYWPEAQVAVQGHEITVKVAKTPWHWYKGLGGSPPLRANEGMLFVFPFAERPGIVMRDMAFPIDILWINNGEIIDMAQNVQPEPQLSEQELTAYLPRSSANMVLEVQAGWAQAHNIKIGDRFTYIR